MKGKQRLVIRTGKDRLDTGVNGRRTMCAGREGVDGK